MAPRAAISNFEIINTLKDFEICDTQTGYLKSKFNSVWKDICATWNNRMKPFNLYFYVHQNRYNVFETYKRMKNVINFNNFKEESIITNEIDDIDTSALCNDSDTSFNSFEWNTQHPCNDKKIQFKIVLSKEQWLNIKPEEKVNNRGEIYYSLKNGWTHILSELIFLQEKLPCAYSFKSQKVIHANDYNAIDYIVKINGICSDHNCKAQIYGQGLFQFINDDNISLEFVILNTTDLLHSKNRFVSGTRRMSFKKHFKHKKADIFRSELIKKYKYDDQIGPLVPYNNVITGVRFEAKNEEFGIKDTVWKSLEYLESDVEFNRAIRQTGFNFILCIGHRNKLMFIMM